MVRWRAWPVGPGLSDSSRDPLSAVEPGGDAHTVVSSVRAAIEVGASFGARSLRPLSTGGYLNYATDDTAETVEDAYAAQTFARLRAAKRTWDPLPAQSQHPARGLAGGTSDVPCERR